MNASNGQTHLGVQQQTHLLALTRELAAQTLQGEPRAPTVRRSFEHLRSSLLTAQPKAYFSRPQAHDYHAIVEHALGSAAERFAPLSSAINAARSLLPWVYHYELRAGEADLANRIAFAELIGPDGPMHASDTRVGFTLLDSHTYYPLHAHPAVELYWVISGRARWECNRRERVVPPGEFVLHDTLEPRAMSTQEEPLLALWGWSGDLDTPAFYL